MIDLHAHILPLLDDHLYSTKQGLDAVSMAVADGIDTIICTPYMGRPGCQRSVQEIHTAFQVFQNDVSEAGFPVQLGLGADISFHPELLPNLQKGELLTLQSSRYFLLRSSHDGLPPDFLSHIRLYLEAGFVPIITHPERSSWIHNQYGLLRECLANGAWVQVTGDCLTGHMGRKSRYWAERLLAEGLVHVLATDTHGVDFQAPLLSEARSAAEKIVGVTEAGLLVSGRPLAVLENMNPDLIPAPPGMEEITRELSA